MENITDTGLNVFGMAGDFMDGFENAMKAMDEISEHNKDVLESDDIMVPIHQISITDNKRTEKKTATVQSKSISTGKKIRKKYILDGMDLKPFEK